jgi:hypothetical protein
VLVFAAVDFHLSSSKFGEAPAFRRPVPATSHNPNQPIAEASLPDSDHLAPFVWDHVSRARYLLALARLLYK